MSTRVAYATETDLNNVWGAALVDTVTGDDAGVRNATAIADALVKASAKIDGYAARRYALPLALIDAGRDQLAECCAILALYALASTSDRLTDIITTRYDQQIYWLRDVSTGKTEILTTAIGGAGTGDPAPITSQEAIVVATNPRLFDRSALREL